MARRHGIDQTCAMSILQRRIFAGIGCLALVALAGWLLRDAVPPADQWIAAHAVGEAGARVATAVSAVGTIACFGMLVVLLVAAWRQRRMRIGGLLRYAVLLACCLAMALSQTVFQRPGPPQHEPDWTYPSGHVVVIGALAVTAVAVASSISTNWARIAAIIGSVVVVAVSVSRIVVAQHWLVDVVAAAIAAVGIGLVAATILRLPLPARSIKASGGKGAARRSAD